eukprot:7798975-Ditylum_brightwellii.AAC.1
MAVIRNTPSNIILKLHSDVLFLLEAKAQSCAGGYFYMENKNDNKKNGLFLIILDILCNAMASVAEAELGALFVDSKKVMALRTMFGELGYKQLPMLIQADNSTAHSIINRNIRNCKSKAIGMCFYWVQYR